MWRLLLLLVGGESFAADSVFELPMQLLALERFGSQIQFGLRERTVQSLDGFGIVVGVVVRGKWRPAAVATAWRTPRAAAASSSYTSPAVTVFMVVVIVCVCRALPFRLSLRTHVDQQFGQRRRVWAACGGTASARGGRRVFHWKKRKTTAQTNQPTTAVRVELCKERRNDEISAACATMCQAWLFIHFDW